MPALPEPPVVLFGTCRVHGRPRRGSRARSWHGSSLEAVKACTLMPLSARGLGDKPTWGYAVTFSLMDVCSCARRLDVRDTPSATRTARPTSPVPMNATRRQAAASQDPFAGLNAGPLSVSM